MTGAPISFGAGSPFHSGLQLCAANYAPLSPTSFLGKAAAVHAKRTAVIHGNRQWTWAETHERCRRLASALRRCGIGRGDTVAIIAPNIPAMYEAHFAVPMIGGVLNTLNTRLDAEAIAFQLAHGEAQVVLVDREFSETTARAVDRLSKKPLLVDIDDPLYAGPGERIGDIEYENFLSEGDPAEPWSLPMNEWDPISLSYTSGTTGDPKGVVTSHRGAYLNSLSQIVTWSMPPHPVYLWTLPMFHCNGWCFPWAVAANAGVNVCLRRVDPPLVLDLIARNGVTHMCGAPIVYSMLIDEAARQERRLKERVQGLVAGAAPPTAMIEGAERAGFDITHVYGLTEVYGPASICVKQPEWEALPLEGRARMNARQGVASMLQDAMSVLDPGTMEPVPADGETVGEIMFRGNITMSGYLKNPEATEAAFAGGWFHTGDLAVVEPDGYARITDRSKDVIISGGENISSVEVEEVLHRHPAVSLAAVVAAPNERWGEVPCAFIEIRAGQTAEADLLQAFCREHLAGYKVPKHFVFGTIPKTATGKVQKFALREAARTMGNF
ncbi:acyl-CoA synthetase [Rhizorhabdus histidinilytica]|uniref:acyl-CoA synthetase n=1 Tax=Rhizorhabdus histidinilytica TaxID=439228 RepID=UPI00322089D7